MANFNVPIETQNPWDGQRVNTAWYACFVNMRNWITQNSQSGTTANRPTTNLYSGRMYFDESLGANGKPIWVNKAGTGWVLADGTAA